jgi:hypothetical protein
VNKYRTEHPGDKPPLTLSERASLRELEREVRAFANENRVPGKAAAFPSLTPPMDIVGSMAAVARQGEHCCDALHRAAPQLLPRTRSDCPHRGSQYLSHAFAETAAQLGTRQSVGPWLDFSVKPVGITEDTAYRSGACDEPVARVLRSVRNLSDQAGLLPS